MPNITLPLKVSTQWRARVLGWLIVVPFAGLFWLIGLGALALGIYAWVEWSKKTPTDVAILLIIGLLLPGLIFAIVYIANGWVHDFLATYEVTQEGITKRSPF